MILNLSRLPVLETERLRLEPLTEADTTGLYPLMGDAEIVAFWEPPEVDDPDMIGELVRGQIEAMRAGGAVHWTMRTLASGGLLGAFELSAIDRRHRTAEIGYLLAPTATGQGYEQEALRTVIAFAAVGGLRKLAARTHLGARRSESVLMNLGFKEEGLLRGHLLKDGERRDCRLFGLLL